MTRERERRGDPLDEVELARGAGRRRGVEDLDRDALDLGAPGAHRTRREARVRDPPHRAVPRRIEHDDQLRRRDLRHRPGAT